MTKLKMLFILSILVIAPIVKAQSTTLTFENLTDGASVTSDYAALGVIFTHTVALTAKISLNEIDFPPHSGNVVIGDDLISPLIITFSAPASGVSAWITYASPLEIKVFNQTGQLIETAHGGGTNNTGTSSFIELNSLDISYLDFSGTTIGSFVLDDLTFSTNSIPSVPEPNMQALMAAGLILIGALRAINKANI